MRRLVLGLLALSALSPVTAVAQDDWREQVLQAVTLDKPADTCGDPCPITATIDRRRLFASLPVLQAHGLISSEITATEVAKHHAYFLDTLGLLVASWVVREAYAANAKLAATKWQVRAIEPTKAGGDVDRELFAFDFDRATFRSMDWSPKSFVNFPRAAPGFSTNLRLTLDMAREMGGGIEED